MAIPFCVQYPMHLQVLLLVILNAAASGSQDYMDRVDPWTKKWSKAVQGPEGILVLELHRCVLKAYSLEGDPLPLEGEQFEELTNMVRSSGLFPDEAWHPLVTDEAWAARMQAFAGLDSQEHVLRKVHDACPVNTENHLEKTIVDVFNALSQDGSTSFGKIVNIGGLYGGRHGEGEDVPDDPTVEILRIQPDSHVLCWSCGDVAAITRVGALANRFILDDVSLLSSKLAAPADFRRVDLLRLDHVPAGQSCRVLAHLLRSGMQPRVVAMLVLSQIPPPFQFAPLSLDIERHPEVLVSCSLALASSLLEPYGLMLLHLTGPYALFVEKRSWRKSLPLNELECYRGASVWGYDDLPLSFVREWLFAPLDETLSHIWNNISAIYAESGQPRAPFTLAVG